MFVVEGADATVGGPVAFEKPLFRLRCFASGLYVAGQANGSAILSSKTDASTVVSFHQAADDSNIMVQNRSRLFLQFPLVATTSDEGSGHRGVWLGAAAEEESGSFDFKERDEGGVQAQQETQNDRIFGTYCFNAVDYRHALESYVVMPRQVRSIDLVITQIPSLEAFVNMIDRGVKPTLLQCHRAKHNWTILINACTESTNEDPLKRDGIPVASVQQRLVDRGVPSLCVAFLDAVRQKKVPGIDVLREDDDEEDDRRKGDAGPHTSDAAMHEDKARRDEELAGSLQVILRLVVRAIRNMAIGNPACAAALTPVIPVLTPFLSKSFGALAAVREILRNNGEILFGDLPIMTTAPSTASEMALTSSGRAPMVKELSQDLFATSMSRANSVSGSNPSQLGALLDYFLKLASRVPKGTSNAYLNFLTVFCECSGVAMPKAQTIIGTTLFQAQPRRPGDDERNDEQKDLGGLDGMASVYLIQLNDEGEVVSGDFQASIAAGDDVLSNGSRGSSSKKSRHNSGGKSPRKKLQDRPVVASPLRVTTSLLGVPDTPVQGFSPPGTPRAMSPNARVAPPTPRQVTFSEAIGMWSKVRQNTRSGPVNYLIGQLTLMASICLGGHKGNIERCQSIVSTDAAMKLLLQSRQLLPDDLRAAFLNYLRASVIDSRNDSVSEKMTDRRLQSWSVLTEKHYASTAMSPSSSSRFGFLSSLVSEDHASTKAVITQHQTAWATAATPRQQRSRGSVAVNEANLMDKNRQMTMASIASFAQKYLLDHSAMDPENASETECVLSCLDVVTEMLKHRHISPADYVTWIRAVTGILDGRDDHVPERDAGFVRRYGKVSRFRYDELFHGVMQCKLRCIDILEEMTVCVAWDKHMDALLKCFYRLFIHHKLDAKKKSAASGDDDDSADLPFLSSIVDFRGEDSDITARCEAMYNERKELLNKPAGGLLGGLVMKGLDAGLGAVSSMGGALLDVGSALTKTLPFGFGSGEEEPPLNFFCNLLDTLLDCCHYEYAPLVGRSANLLVRLLSYHTTVASELKQIKLFLNGDEIVLYSKLAVLVESLQQSCKQVTQKGNYRAGALRNILTAITAVHEEIGKSADADALAYQNAQSACRTLNLHLILTQQLLGMMQGISSEPGVAQVRGAGRHRQKLVEKIVAKAYMCLDFVIGDHKGVAFAAFDNIAAFADHLFIACDPAGSSSNTSEIANSSGGVSAPFVGEHDDDSSCALFVFSRFFAELDDGISVDISRAVPTIVAAVAKMRGDVRYRS